VEGGGFPNRAHNEKATAGFSALMVQQSVTCLIGGPQKRRDCRDAFRHDRKCRKHGPPMIGTAPTIGRRLCGDQRARRWSHFTYITRSIVPLSAVHQ
jgi:hypothetical protein